MQVIYRPHKGKLEDAMEMCKVFPSFEAMQEYVAKDLQDWNFNVRPCEIVAAGKPHADKRIGWLDSDYLCVDAYAKVNDKNGYLMFFGGKYDHPLCIGMFATKWTR